MLLLENAINRYLALDPEALHQLAELRGKVIRLEITGINRSFCLMPDIDGVRVRLDNEDLQADTVLRGSPSALFRMGMASDVSKLLLGGEVEISGDTRLGHRFKKIFDGMDIDWSEPLASVLGDAVANQMVEGGRKLFDWVRGSTDSVTRSVGEYLQEESRDVVTGTEIDIFAREVDEVRDGVDRLQARIDAYMKRNMDQQPVDRSGSENTD